MLPALVSNVGRFRPFADVRVVFGGDEPGEVHQGLSAVSLTRNSQKAPLVNGPPDPSVTKAVKSAAELRRFGRRSEFLGHTVTGVCTLAYQQQGRVRTVCGR